MADEARQRKVQDRIQQTVARLLGRRIKDPRLGFVTITDVRVTGDLQHASIFYTVLGDEEDRKGTARAFESAKGIIRSEIGKALGIRLTPSIEFILDALPESAAAIEGALAAAKARDEEIAKLAEGASYAGEADPYRKDEEFDEDEDDDSDEDDLDDDDSDEDSETDDDEDAR
ncbi:30S ribosome-binding factor RbfA [Actinomyces culturomici]|uniref:30S ribosome-binding factor RbfA n=1 Tax=Actinomyces culturomici TaxID=1926276 RepID=UPI000E20A623|nr:30S ribosome-binding factor RbfA [Actinomyces culturomici]